MEARKLSRWVLLLTFAAGAGTAHLISTGRAEAADVAAPTERWDYYCAPDIDRPWREGGDAINAMKNLGAKGWELVLQMEKNPDVWCFKRPRR